jgi:hypothetical protein
VIPSAATTGSITGDDNHCVRVAAIATSLRVLGDDHVDTETSWLTGLLDVHHRLHPQATGVVGGLY